MTVNTPNPDPTTIDWFDPVRNLVRAGALIAAEIDRRLRDGAQP